MRLCQDALRSELEDRIQIIARTKDEENKIYGYIASKVELNAVDENKIEQAIETGIKEFKLYKSQSVGGYYTIDFGSILNNEVAAILYNYNIVEEYLCSDWSNLEKYIEENVKYFNTKKEAFYYLLNKNNEDLAKIICDFLQYDINKYNNTEELFDKWMSQKNFEAPYIEEIKKYIIVDFKR